jgi:CheY-like chemotaxis protein
MADEVANSVPFVLLVEDDKDSREMYEIGLRLSGLEAHGAGSAEEALAIIARVRPAVIVTDLTLPDLNGLELCRRLEGDPDTRDIPRIVLTGHTADRDAESALAAACRRVLQKPCAPDALASAIAQVLGRN